MRRKMLRVRVAFAALFILCTAPLFGIGDKILHSFNEYPLGSFPGGGLVSDAAGNLYGAAYGGPYNQGVIFELSPNSQGGWRERAIYAFRNANYFSGVGLIIDAAGNLYGSGYGGPRGYPMIYVVSPSSDGTWKFSILYQFTQGVYAFFGAGPLAIDPKGNLYVEMNPPYGTHYSGSVFELTRSGGVWTGSTVYQFTGGNDGGGPSGGLTSDNKGNLYGVTVGGGASDGGVVFELTPSSGGSWTETVLHPFTPGVDGSYPDTRLVFDQSGDLFGTAEDFGGTCTSSGGCGIVFELKPASNGQWTESLVYSFGSTDYVGPSGVVVDTLGNLYGSTGGGGIGNCYSGCGTVFELSPSSGGHWAETVLYNFTGGKDGFGSSSVILGSGGQLYGETESSALPRYVGLVFQLTPTAAPPWQDRNIFAFLPSNDGQSPTTTLVSDVTGNLYGTTAWGGANGSYELGGTVFKVTPLGATSIIYSFGPPFEPYICCPSSLTFDTAGNIYGTFQDGAYGSVFELSPVSGGWAEKSLYTFQGGTDGQSPTQATLAMDGAGNLYGTTSSGGKYGNGIVFELSEDSHGNWTKTTLHDFAGGPRDGNDPEGGVIFDQAGQNLYGTTRTGGNGNNGTVYELSPSLGAWSETIVYSFAKSGVDGALPLAGLIFDKVGNLYGTTSAGGVTCNCGTVFMLSPTSGGGWTETLLHSFSNTGSDGIYPAAGLTLDSSGNLYGTTQSGGGFNCENIALRGGCGTLFELSPSFGGWDETILHAFTGLNALDGANPYGGVILGPNQRLYGTTALGGQANQGTVFELQP